MSSEAALFWIFAAILLGAAFRVITARNPVHAVLFLVLAFFSTACLWMLLRAEFLAIVLVLVYVGAVMVLFLFVVMMLDINVDRIRQGFWRHFPLAALVGVVIALQLWAVLSNGRWQSLEAPAAPAASTGYGSNTAALGVLTFSEYSFPLQIAGVILLVAMIAAIALTLRERRDSKHQDPAQQIQVRRADRVRLVSMATDAEARQDARRA